MILHPVREEEFCDIKLNKFKMTLKETKVNNCKRLIMQLKKRKENPQMALENYPEAIFKKAQKEIEFDRLAGLTFRNCRDE